ncbi:MAG: TRAP transporter large permease [Firmicutes bacterium]|nr:TRAP transporter large permease [Bacillota bacterium]
MTWIIVSAFVVLLAAGIPIPFVLGLISLLFFLMDGFLPLALIPQRMFTATDSFPMMAIPLFMLVGELMNAGGISQRLIRFSKALVGHITGGLAHVNILSSGFFAGISGSAAADASALGSILIPAMVRGGYTAPFSAAVTAGSSLIGPIIPPSIPMILYGVIAGTSISTLFVAGIVPGILMGLTMMIVSWWMCRREGIRGEPRASARELWESAKDASFGLVLPIIILGGILGGVFTPTEAAAVGVLVAFVVGAFIYRAFTWNHIAKALVSAGMATGVVMLVIAFSQSVAFVLASQQIPQLLANGLFSLTDQAWLLILFLLALLLAVGTLLEPAGALVILTPVLLPLANRLGLDLIQFGVLLVLGLVIGMVTPPVGSCLFIVSSISRLRLETVARAVLPFIGAAVVVLLLVAYVPAITLWLPGLLR